MNDIVSLEDLWLHITLNCYAREASLCLIEGDRTALNEEALKIVREFSVLSWRTEGDRIAVMFPGAEDIRAHAESLRRGFEGRGWPISAGAATMQAPIRTVEQVARAIAALASARAAGGNRVVLAPKHHTGKNERHQRKSKQS